MDHAMPQVNVIAPPRRWKRPRRLAVRQITYGGSGRPSARSAREMQFQLPPRFSALASLIPESHMCRRESRCEASITSVNDAALRSPPVHHLVGGLPRFEQLMISGELRCTPVLPNRLTLSEPDLILAQQLRAELPIPVEIAALRHLPKSDVEG